MAEDLMDKVFSFFSNDDLTDDKQNMLKAIAKELGQSKYAKFFKIRSEEADPSFSSFLFSIYKVIYPIKLFFKDQRKLAVLRSSVVDSCTDSTIKDTVKRLAVPALDAKAKTMTGEQLIASIQGDIEILVSQFDASKIAAANHRYELAGILGQFVKYDFLGFFRKFDPHFADGSFLVEPKFPAIKTILIVDQIGDFLTSCQSLKPEEDWVSLLNLLKAVEGQELVNPDQFTNMIKMLREVYTSKILELMVQYTLRNPVWQYKHIAIRETIGEAWLDAKKAEANGYIAKINNAKKNKQISALIKEIFETSDLTRLENYTTPLGEAYKKRNLDYYRYADGLNYLKSFLEDFVDKEMKEMSDILLIRGQWTNNQGSKEMSEALHTLDEMQEPINTLDTVLGEDGNDGSRLKQARLRVDRDQSQARYINSILGKVNAEAQDIINEAAQALIVVGKHMKNLIEDLQKKHPELLVNWKELNLVSKDPLSQRMVTDFKKINYFIQLMRLCTQ
jgi:hypothetical protein